VTENTVLTKQRNNITTRRDINDQNWEEIFVEDAKISFNKFFKYIFEDFSFLLY